MGKKKKFLAPYIIGSAIIWGVAILASSLMLKGTECFGEINHILGTTAGIHLILIWGSLAAQFKNREESNLAANSG